MIIDSVTVGPFEENCYLVADEETRRAVLIDPGDEGERILRMVERARVSLDAIWLTHGHVDHIGAIAAVLRRHDVPVHLHPLDRPLYDRSAEVAAMYGVPFESPPAPDRELGEGGVLTLGALRFEVIHVPGHAPGHVAFVADGVIFGGDLLFAGSVGRTDLPFCDPRAMQASLRRAASLPPATVVHAGHGPSTTIGTEVRTNPFLSGMARPAGRTARV